MLGFVTTSIYKSVAESRVNKIDINGKSLVTPCYFPAVSSCVTTYSTSDLLKFLGQHSRPLLTSAYDLYTESLGGIPIEKQLEELSANVILLDSGRYESSWFNDTDWTFERYREVVQQALSDFYMSFDVFPGDAQDHFEQETISHIRQSIAVRSEDVCIPVLHMTTHDTLFSMLETITTDGVKLVALPERELGDTILERCSNLYEVRQFLDSRSPDVLIHILGCGHPVSLLLYIYAGADTFDSLDWQKFVIDPSDLSFRDYSHLFLTNCHCRYCSNDALPYVHRVYLHNLLFIKQFLNDIILSIKDDTFESFLKRYVSPPVLGGMS